MYRNESGSVFSEDLNHALRLFNKDYSTIEDFKNCTSSNKSKNQKPLSRMSHLSFTEYSNYNEPDCF